MKVATTIMVAIAASGAIAADLPAGKATFERFCSECHAPGFGHPGTQQLEIIRGKPFSVLQARKDLVPAYVTLVVRNGLAEMPPFRPTEISDATLVELAQYIAPGKDRTIKR